MLKALADIATGAKSLDAALGTSGLAAVANEMAHTAEDHARHFTHPGPARDDAIALFWQVAPQAFADSATFAAAHLDPALTADRMVTAIKAGHHARDFTAAPLPEAFFRAVAQSTLQVMLSRADTVAALAPALWRESLKTSAAIKDETAEILALVRELHAVKQTTVPEITLIAMARKISPRVTDRAEALRALEAAVDHAAEAQARGEAGSNVDDFVDATLRRLAAITAEGRLDEAAAAADDAVDQAEAGLAQLLDAAINQHLLGYDAEGAARQVVKRLMLDTPTPSGLFGAILQEEDVWFERGREKGLRLDLEVAVSLARMSHTWARDAGQRGAGLNGLGTALWALGDLESDTTRLEEAVTTFRAALGEWTRERVPNAWAMIQNNLGVALKALGERQSGSARLEEAVVAHRAALEERTREGDPRDWAHSQNNLGIALARLGERERATVRLEEAVTTFRSALREITREREPHIWAKVQCNLGNALLALGERSGGLADLGQAVAAFRAAAGEVFREQAPLQWAGVQNGLGGALRALGEAERSEELLKEAVEALHASLEEWTRERVPLDWAGAQHNLGLALRALGERGSGTARLEEAVSAFRAALEERTRERVPLDWALARCDQGIALRILAERSLDVTMARGARDQMIPAVATMRSGGHLYWADRYAEQLGAVEALVDRLAGTVSGE